MSHLIESASAFLVDNGLSGVLFALLLLLVFAEAGLFVGFVLPGETALLLGGVFTATGVLPYKTFVVAAVVAAAAGDSFGYWIGHRWGGRMRESRLGRRIGPHRWSAAEGFMTRNGGKAVFLGRSQALMRALVPFLSGQSRMPYRTFFPWNVAGATLWGGGVVVLGHVFAHSVTTVEHVLGWFGLAVLTAVVVVILVRHARARRGLVAQEGVRLDGTGDGAAEEAG